MRLYSADMREIDANDLDHLGADAGVVFASLKFEPKNPNFHAARRALGHLGASYDRHIRAWRLPLDHAAVEPLKRLYRLSSLALWVADVNEDITADSFERYR